MLHRVVAHKIEVNIRRHIDRVFLEPVGRVIDNIEVPRETITLRVNRHKRQIYTRIAVNHDCIHNIVLVEGNGNRGVQRRDEAVEQQIHVIVIDIYVLEYGVHILLEG